MFVIIKVLYIMLRKEYQKKFMKSEIDRLEKLNNMEKEIEEVFYLFEELYQETNKSNNTLTTIEDKIEAIKTEVKESEKELLISKDTKESIYTKVLFPVIGLGLGSLGIIYSPYLGIGSIIGGGIVGSIASYLLS
jgi:hypothetical protein